MVNDMRRFITRKVKKKIRYKFFYNVCLVGIPLIIISNILIMMFFNIFSEDSVLDILVSSSYGNIYNNSNNNFFYKNLYGFDLKKTKQFLVKVILMIYCLILKRMSL